MKQKKITHTMQKVAVDILGDFEVLMMTHNGPYSAEEVWAIMEKHAKNYELCDDPFTRMWCTTKEWAENSLEYDKAVMIERYGHCDGLD